LKLSTEARAKISAANKKRKGERCSAITRAKISVANRKRKGEKRSPLSIEHRIKISIAHKGRKHSAEHRAKVGAASKGRKLSIEARTQISAANKGQNNGFYKHGLSFHPLHNTYNHMIHRCYNLSFYDYREYGKKGVTVWEPWRNPNTFISGLLSLIGDRPIGYTLDRINPHGDYVEWNIRWADQKTQRANRRKNVIDYHSQCGEH
jgi:hypothetical protein